MSISTKVFITLMTGYRIHYQAWAKCIRIRIHKYSNTFFKVFIFVFEYFCEKCKLFVFVFEYISKVFVFMNTFRNTFNIFQFLLIFFHPVLTSYHYVPKKTNKTYLINTFSQ